jgi:TctA family transporter
MIGPSLSGFTVPPVLSGCGWAVVFFVMTTVSEYEIVERYHLDIVLTGAAGLVVYLLNQAGSALLPGAVGFVLVLIVLEVLRRSLSADEDRFSIM